MNKKTKLAIISIIALILVTIGITYAYWLITKSQKEDNVVSTACLDISLTNEQNDIFLTNQFPLSDEDGAKLVPYTFTITNNCNKPTQYRVALETFESTSTIQSSSVKAQLDKNTAILLSSVKELETTIANATNSYLLQIGTLAAKDTEGSSVTHELRIWIDANAPITERGKELESKISVSVGQDLEEPEICQAVTTETVTTGNIPEGNYENGDEYICEVKDDTFYHFFVIGKENTGEINLIMDRNVGSDGTPATAENLNRVEWINHYDYEEKNTAEIAAGTADTVDNANLSACVVKDTTKYEGDYVCSEEGPITALNNLQNYVSTWENIPDTEYNMTLDVYVEDENAKGTLIVSPNASISDIAKPYSFIRSTTAKMKARMMTIPEAVANGCNMEYSTTENNVTTKNNVNSCPLYLSNNLQHKEGWVSGESVVNITGIRGYWLMNAGGGVGFLIHDNGSINTKPTYVNDHSGLRPVITLDLSNFNI